MKIVHGMEAAKTSILKRPTEELTSISPAIKQKIKEAFARELTLSEAVECIINEVRSKGDAALFDYARRLDKVELKRLPVTKEEIAEAYSQADKKLIIALEVAAERIRSFHLVQRRQGGVNFTEGGLGQIIIPLERVGIYVPGGTASYPSTVLMTAIPAKVAGVKEVIAVTPPQRNGGVSAATLVAANIAGVDSIFKVGGAQAIAALAFGTESIPKVDKICGPGNIFVMIAKKLVYGAVEIDGLYGPTETVIVADNSANPVFCAADLLAQAEHDSLASAILVTTSPELAHKVEQEVERQLPLLERRDIAAASLRNQGGIIIVDSVEQAIELVNYYAPEHVSLMVLEAWSCVSQIKNAGGIFLGESSPEALGDYVAGPSHVMPTGGTARFSSTLSVDDFIKITSLVALDRKALQRLGMTAALIARAEGLSGHARALELRLE